MSIEEKHLFYKYLDRSHIFFEFGSGGSTYQAAKRNLKIFSVESDVLWHQKIQCDFKRITDEINEVYKKNNILIKFLINITYLTVDLHVKPNSWGTPGNNTNFTDWIKYSRIYNHSKYNADFILIDGRFRVACALNIYKQINNRVMIYIHDFFDRKHYHILLDYYDIVDRADKSAVLRKKCIAPHLSANLVNKYESNFSLTIL